MFKRLCLYPWCLSFKITQFGKTHTWCHWALTTCMRDLQSAVHSLISVLFIILPRRRGSDMQAKATNGIIIVVGIIEKLLSQPPRFPYKPTMLIFFFLSHESVLYDIWSRILPSHFFSTVSAESLTQNVHRTYIPLFKACPLQAFRKASTGLLWISSNSETCVSRSLRFLHSLLWELPMYFPWPAPNPAATNSGDGKRSTT